MNISIISRPLACLSAVTVLLTSCRDVAVLVPSVEGADSLEAPAKQAFVWIAGEDEPVTYSKNGSDVVYPASITKLAVALYAMELMPTETIIEPGEETYFPPEGSSFAYIRPQHTLTLEMLIEGMLIPSGNDAAYAVAVACGRSMAEEDIEAHEAVEVFMEGLNDYVAELGCTSTHFTVPDGFAGAEHYSTSYDIALIARAAVENEVIMRYAGMYEDDVIYASGHINHWTNTNELLDPTSSSYDKCAIGLKTGSTEGNYCLVAVYEDGSIIGVFGCPTDSARYTAVEKIRNVG